MIRALLWLVLAVAALSVMQRYSARYAQLTGPHEISVQPGQTGAARDLKAVLYRLETAKSLVWDDPNAGEIRRGTNGLWLLADLSLDTVAAPAAAVPVWRGVTGRRYAASGRVAGAPGVIPRGPVASGLSQRGYAVFELPPDEIPGGMLEIGASLAPMFDAVLVMVPPGNAVVAHEALRLGGAGGVN